MQRAFTLIELLVVIAILSVLAVVVVLTLNPAGLLQESRDADRISDMATLNNAISYSLADNSTESLGSANTVYVSVPDPSATSTAGDQCQGLGLPSLPASDTYQCTSATNYRLTNGAGWISLNLSANSFGSSIVHLPVDPTNTTSTGLYYTYATNGSQFEVASLFESAKYKLQYGNSTMDPDYPEVDAKGSNLAVSPLWNPSGLVAWWPLDEGSGTAATDFSGSGNTGSWNGTKTGTSGYYSGGKVGSWAGNFDGSTDYVNTPSSSLPLGSSPRSVFAWINVQTACSSACLIYNYGAFSVASENSGLALNSSNDLEFIAISDNFNSSLLPTVGSWHFVGYTYNGGTIVTIYLDGQSQTSTVTALNTVLPASDPSDIGKASNGFTDYFQGLVNDLRVYNRALSAAEVQALYNAEH